MTRLYHLSCILALISACFLIRETNPAAPRAGPFRVIFKKGGTCPKAMNGRGIFHFEDKIYWASRTYSYMLVNATFDVPVDDNIKNTLKLAIMTNQGWKDNYFVLDAGGACSAAKTYIPTIFADVARSINLKSCPIPPGTYTNVKIDLSNASIGGLTYMFYNEYRGRVISKINDEVVNCMEVYGSIVPKGKSG